MIRPLNLLDEKNGSGSRIFDVHGVKIRVSNLLGTATTEMKIDDPYNAITNVIGDDQSDIHIIDFHAEYTGEKKALALSLKNSISAFIGTHTHVQTNDAQILTTGVLYISDAGMCGYNNGVLGTEANSVIERVIFKNDKARFKQLDEGETIFNAVILNFDDITFDCVDVGFKENEPVDVVIRPEDIDIVPVDQGKMTGTVESVLFKGVHYEVMVETVPGTHVTVNMHVRNNQNILSDDRKEAISANDFYLDLEDMKDIDDKEIVARADAQAWNPETDEYLSIKVETDLKEEIGEYNVKFSTNSGLQIIRKIWVVDQRVVENKKANEAVSAFNFFKSKDEIMESHALDTDLKTWANAQGWKLNNEDEGVDLSVDYDFDPEKITEGIYKVTFWTTGREFKIHTTDYVEEGKEVGLSFFPEDIHVMEKMEF